MGSPLEDQENDKVEVGEGVEMSNAPDPEDAAQAASEGDGGEPA